MSRKKKKPRAPRRPRRDETLHLVLSVPEMESPTLPQSLVEYHDLMSRRLKFPFNAMYLEPLENGRFEVAVVQVLRLVPLERTDERDGLLVEAEFPDGLALVPLNYIQLKPENPAFSLVTSYAAWREGTEGEQSEAAEIVGKEEFSPEEIKSGLFWFLRVILYGAAAGAVVNVILRAVPGAETSAWIAAGIVAFLGLLLGFMYASAKIAHRSKSIRTLISCLILSLIGGIVGFPLGALVMAFVGTIPGGFAAGWLARRLRQAELYDTFVWSAVGTFAGGFAYALYRNADALRQGIGFGLLGGAAAVVLFLVLAVLLEITIYSPRRS